MRRLLVLAVACGGPQVAATHQADMSKYLPATLEAGDKAKPGDPRPIHVRVWADASVRAGARWKEDITDQLDYAGQILQPMFGARIQVDGWKDWDRTGDLKDALEKLAAADDGKDVAWVIGYTAPGDATKVMTDLGDAAPLGHHVVIHAWADKPETDALAAELPAELKDAERTEILSAHRRHKQTVVLLHQLAVTLGAVAETDKGWIQHPSYSSKQVTFSDRNRELMQLALDDRLGGGTDVTTATKVLEYLDKTEWGGWIAADKEQVTTQVKMVVDAAKSGKTATDVPPSAYAQFDRIRQLVKVGDTQAALAELDNMLKAYPGNGTMHELKCEIMLAANAMKTGKDGKPLPPAAPDQAALAACARVTELVPGDPTPHLAVGEAYYMANDLPSARAEWVKAEDKITNLPQGQADAWKRLIGDYYKIGALTWIEGAVVKAKLDSDPIAAEVAHIRARYGIPKGAKFVKPEDEGLLREATVTAIGLGEGGKKAEAEKLLDQADKKWPNAPGLVTARCDLAVRANQLDSARAYCAKALKLDPDESQALYLSAILAFKDTSASGTKDGIAKLKHAIAVDPDLAQAWHTLAKAYARDKDKAALDQLGKDYAAKFGQALPN